MATSKTATLSMQTVKNATSPTSVSYTIEPEVINGVLTPGIRQSNPGVFSQGTASESYGGANINFDSNS